MKQNNIQIKASNNKKKKIEMLQINQYKMIIKKNNSLIKKIVINNQKMNFQIIKNLFSKI